MEHFKSHNNTKVGLRIWSIADWYPVIGGISQIASSEHASHSHTDQQAMMHVVKQCMLVLNSLNVLVDFKDVSKGILADAAHDAFEEEYLCHGDAIKQLIELAAYQVLNNSFFKAWTTIYMQHFRSKTEGVPIIEYFASSDWKKERHIRGSWMTIGQRLSCQWRWSERCPKGSC
jgi:hypothetical protein